MKHNRNNTIWHMLVICIVLIVGGASVLITGYIIGLVLASIGVGGFFFWLSYYFGSDTYER